MGEPTDKEIVEVLAKACGGRTLFIPDVFVTEAHAGAYSFSVGQPGGVSYRRVYPLHSLDSMTVVEAEIERRGMYSEYLLKRFGEDSWDMQDGIEIIDPFETAPMIDRQSAALRARAAYEVLKLTTRDEGNES